VGAVVGRDFKLVRRVQLAKIMAHARRLDAPLAAVVRDGEDGLKGGQEPRIEFANGVVAMGWSGADVDRLTGHELDWAWVDEADLQDERVFTMCLERQGAARTVRLIVTSSPRASGWLRAIVLRQDSRWDPLWARGLVRVHRWATEDNPALSPDTVAVVRAALEAQQQGLSRQELEGKFLGTDEAPTIGSLTFGRAFVGRLALTSEEARPAALGVDVGETFDFTWLTVLSAKGVVLAQHRFNANTPGVVREQLFPVVIERVVEHATRWRVPRVVVDTSKAGAPVAQFVKARLRELGSSVHVEGYATGATGAKAKALEALGVAMSRGEVRVPSAWSLPGQPEVAVSEVEQLRKELLELVVDDREGRRSFHAPKGGHDDGVVALALAWQALARPTGQVLASLSALSAQRNRGHRYHF
jgi:hypothetical protein